MTALSEIVRIDDPQFYVDNPYAVFATMRAQAPVYYCESLNTFAITRYEDVRDISRTPGLWSVSGGILLNDVKYGHIADSFFQEGAELISLTDPPRHGELRRVISPVFTARKMSEVEDAIRRFTRNLLASITPGEEIEFIDDVAVLLPLWTVARLLGLAGDNLAQLRYWTDEMLKMGNDLSAEALAQAAANIAPMNDYLLEQLAQKRDHPDDGLLSALSQAEIDNEKLTDLNVLMLSTAVLAGGNTTTRSLLGSLIVALAENPEQRAMLASDPSLAPQAVDEALRYVSPIRGFLRTALSDTELHGQPIAKGQHAYLLYVSANHDETVFHNPEAFDLTRTTYPAHLAFGFGPHVCPGSSLARLECRVFLEELMSRFPAWEITRTPRRTFSVVENGWLSIPVTFSRK